MRCNKCGTELPDNAKFCANCGSTMESVEPRLVHDEQPERIVPAPAEVTPSIKLDKPKKKGKTGIIIGILVLIIIALAAALILFILPKFKKIDYRAAYKEIVTIGDEINKSFSNDYCGVVVNKEKNVYYSVDDYIISIEKCKNNYGISLLPEVEKLGKLDAVKRDSEIKEQYDKFKAEYDKIHDKADGLEAKLEDYLNMHKFKVDVYKNLKFSTSTDDEIDNFAATLGKVNIEEVKEYSKEWVEKYKAHAAVIRDYQTDLDNMLKTRLVYENSAEWEARNSVSLAGKKEIDDKEPTISKYYPLETMNYYNLKQEYKTLRALIATKYQENYKFGTNDCDEKGDTVVCK